MWEHVLASCLAGDSFVLGDEAIRSLSEIANDPERLTALISSVDARAGTRRRIPAWTAALVRMLRSIAEAAEKTDQAQLETVLRNISAALGQVSPEMMLELLAHRGSAATLAANLGAGGR